MAAARTQEIHIHTHQAETAMASDRWSDATREVGSDGGRKEGVVAEREASLTSMGAAGAGVVVGLGWKLQPASTSAALCGGRDALASVAVFSFLPLTPAISTKCI